MAETRAVGNKVFLLFFFARLFWPRYSRVCGARGAVQCACIYRGSAGGAFLFLANFVFVVVVADDIRAHLIQNSRANTRSVAAHSGGEARRVARARTKKGNTGPAEKHATSCWQKGATDYDE